MIRMLGEYWQGIVAILLVCSLASFTNQKFGIVISALITLGSVALTILLGAAGAVGFHSYLPFGLGLFPGLAWIGFWLGRVVRRKQAT